MSGEPRGIPSTITVDPGLLVCPAGTTATLTSANLLVVDHSTNPSTDAQLLITVTTPPSHGVLKLSGAPTSEFTKQDLVGGLITYTSTDGASDNFSVFARATTTPNVAKPYTPQFTTASETLPSSDGAVYMATALVGSTQCPVTRTVGCVQGGGGLGTTHSATFSIDYPNSVVVFAVWSTPLGEGGTTGPVNISSITATGLTLTHIGGGQVTTSTAGFAHIWNTVDWYWAPVASPLSTTVTVTFAASFAHSNMFIGHHVFTGVASIAAPWDTNASNFNVVTTATPPIVGSLTADAPDPLVLPVFYWVVSGDSMRGSGYTPVKGYDDIGYAIGTVGVFGADKRASGAGTVPIFVYDDTPVIVVHTLTDAELVFNPTPAFVDFAVEGNRRRFVGPTGAPQFLGLHGDRPFTTTPAVYLSAKVHDPEAFARNDGTGGPFAIVRSGS